MPVRLRFSLHGHRHKRIFHLVAVNQGAKRDAKPTELLGIFHRYPAGDSPQKTVEWSVDRIRYWLSVGAIPTKAVSKLLEVGNILTPASPYHSSALRAKITSSSHSKIPAPTDEKGKILPSASGST
ncbi:hypothetical protein H0H92_003144 [Tricholoma furcatifolium]|nr:hypothetical protein H0H92_003144 [Tricholoma furcatifolium]